MSDVVRRLAPPQLEPRLDIVVSHAVEAIVSLAMIAGKDVRCDTYEVGCDWFDHIRTRLSAELQTMMEPFQSWQAIHALWHGLLGVVAEGPAALPEVLAHLEAMPADEFWLQAVGFHERHEPAQELRAAMVAAGRGSLEPLERLLADDPHTTGRWLKDLARALGGDAEGTQRRVLSLLARWDEEVFAGQWAEIEPIVERDAGEKRRLARDRTVAAVVEEATNGGEYVPEAGIGRLLLVPTYLGRPWVIQERQRGTLVMVHPVGETALTDSPEEARRRRVMRLARALSDDTRLRALRRLAESSRSLVELADDLGIRKSTMHHHLAVLRSAGLLRTRFGEKRYSLRDGPLAEMSGLLGDYLGTTDSKSTKRRRG